MKGVQRVWGFLSLLAVLSAVPSRGQYSLTTNNGSITITSYTGSGGQVQIPSVINGLPVTGIGDSAFRTFGGTRLTSVTIPDSVTTIGDFAFNSDRALTNVTIGSGVTSIGPNTFTACNAMQAFNVDPANASYSSADGILFDKTQSTLVRYPGSKAGAYAIPASVRSIADYAFAACDKLTSITVPDTVTSIGEHAFERCTALAAAHIGAGVTTIKERTFSSTALTSVDLPQGLLAIDRSAFSASALKTITLPETLTTIGAVAFSSCHQLTTLTIPRDVTSIGAQVCSGCERLTAFAVDPLNTSYTAIDGALFDKAAVNLLAYPRGKPGAAYTAPPTTRTIADHVFEDCDKLTDVTLPDAVTDIGHYAFAGCVNLIHVTAPAGLKTIGNSAFERCWLMDGFPLPAGLMTIGTWAFFNCNGLTDVAIPDSVTAIGMEAFIACINITTASIGRGAINIGHKPFMGCPKLPAITVDPLNPAYVSKDGVLLTKDQTAIIEFPEARPGPYKIPDTVTNLEDWTFAQCASLTSVTIPESITRIPPDCFENCTGLTNATIAGSVTNVDGFSFYYCTNLQSVYFGGNAPTLGANAFFANEIATIYYLPETTGWESTFGGGPWFCGIQLPARMSSAIDLPSPLRAVATCRSSLKLLSTSQIPSGRPWPRTSLRRGRSRSLIRNGPITRRAFSACAPLNPES